MSERIRYRKDPSNQNLEVSTQVFQVNDRRLQVVINTFERHGVIKDLANNDEFPGVTRSSVNDAKKEMKNMLFGMGVTFEQATRTRKSKEEHKEVA